MMKPSRWYAGLAVGASLLLVACGGDDKGAPAPSASTSTITGTAAIGAPMVGASITLRCLNNGSASTTSDASGEFTVTVPTVNLPCAISAAPAGGGQSHYSVTSGSGSVVANISPMTSLALALAGATPDATWFAALNNAGLQALAAALNAAVSNLSTALSGYALPANFNPFSSPLIAPAAGQSGNDYDRLLEQLQAALDASADPSFANLLASAAGGSLTLPTPPRTPGATSVETFFTTFAGGYNLKVTSVVSEGVSAGAAALFPLGSARAVTIGANGDVTFAAVGRTITYAAADYNRDFTGTASTQNQVNYRDSDTGWLELSIFYDPATGELRLDPAGFLANDEGLATLKGPVYLPTSAPPVATCSSGDDKLVFTNGPADFCGFSRSASANSITNYFQFTSAAGTHGVTYVKFDMNSDDSAVLKVTIENDAYAFGCGGALPACTGVSVSTGSSYKQFTLSDTALAVINGAIQGITVNGLLIHPVTSPPPEPAGTLAGLIGAAHAGTYVLSCPVAGGGSANRTVVINADGSSTVDGNAVVDGSHAGGIGASFNNVTSSGTWTLPAPTYNLFFNANGTLMAGPVHGATGSLMGCTAVSGARAAALNPATVIAGYARSAQLTCTHNFNPGTPVTRANPDGSTAFAIDSNGVVTLGELRLSAADYNGTNPNWSLEDNATYPIQYIESRVLRVSDYTGNTATEVKLKVELNADDSLRNVVYENQGHRGTCWLPAS